MGYVKCRSTCAADSTLKFINSNLKLREYPDSNSLVEYN